MKSFEERLSNYAELCAGHILIWDKIDLVELEWLRFSARAESKSIILRDTINGWILGLGEDE